MKMATVNTSTVAVMDDDAMSATVHRISPELFVMAFRAARLEWSGAGSCHGGRHVFCEGLVLGPHGSKKLPFSEKIALKHLMAKN